MQGEEEFSSASESTGIPNLSEAIEKLMAHPEILSMAASVLGQGAEKTDPESSTQEASAGGTAEEKPSTETSSGNPLGAVPDLLGLLGPMLSKGSGSEKRPHHGKGISRSTALLLALKPYLSPSRCEAVDKLVQLGKIGEVFEKLY